MSEKRKPDVRVVLRPADGTGTITLAAFWTGPGEIPSGGLDRRIKRLVVELEDGSRVTVSNEHGSRSHWCNLYTDQSAPRPREPRAADPTDAHERPDFGDDGVPF